MPGFIDNQTFQRWIALGAMSLCIVGAAAAHASARRHRHEPDPPAESPAVPRRRLMPKLRNSRRPPDRHRQHARLVRRNNLSRPRNLSARARRSTRRIRNTQAGSRRAQSRQPTRHIRYPPRHILRIINPPPQPRPEVSAVTISRKPTRRLLRRLRRSNGGVAEVIPGQPRLHPSAKSAAMNTARRAPGPNSDQWPNAPMESRTADLRRGIRIFNQPNPPP